MNTLRKVLFFLVPVMFAVFAGPASADSSDSFSLALSPLQPIAQPGPITFTATIKMLSKYDSLKSYTITVPAGLTISGAPIPSAGTASASGQVVTGSGVQIAYNKTPLQVTIKATPNPAYPCGTTPSLTWTATAKGGFLVSNEVFTLDPATAPRTTMITPLCYTVSGSVSAGGTVTCASPVNAGGSSNCSVVINPGYTFTGFSANCGAPSTSTSCTVSNVQSNQIVTASFSQIPYSVTAVASPMGGGVVTCNPTPVFYNGLSTCSVTTVNPGYNFTGFSANCGAPSTSTSCTVSNVQSNQIVTASFTLIQYSVTATTNPPTVGTVSCVTPVTYGQSSLCTATLQANWTLTGFSNCGAPTTATSCTVSNVQGNVSNVTANYVANNLTIASTKTSAAVGKVFPVTVTLAGGPDATVTLTPTGCPAPYGVPPPPTLSVSGVATFNLTFTATGACTLTASAPNYNPPPGPLNFVVYAVDSQDCKATPYTSNKPIDGSLDPDQDLAYVGNPGDWGLRREINTDSSTCNPVNFTLTVDTGSNTSNLAYDKASGQNSGAFKYVVLWQPKPVDPSGWANFQPTVSWGILNPVPGTTDYVHALLCVSDPADWSMLTPAALVALLPVIPNLPEYALNPNSQFQPGIDPLTLLPRTAKMCIVQQGYTLLAPPAAGQIQYWDKVLDESDGHVGGP